MLDSCKFSVKIGRKYLRRYDSLKTLHETATFFFRALNRVLLVEGYSEYKENLHIFFCLIPYRLKSFIVCFIGIEVFLCYAIDTIIW